ncbi:lysozyme [Croceimicrobium hydrocarbonivorans]|uniref:Lysozyme n=1 Tax=Croceimicrobium hydrocarbonivorans TaxID=2761580 RepID=A0A7H0VBA6_9FLAO|nr:lysozyme [Croceimicrobium hydrocarbonivorans]QNR22961.1 lysozyme [Croceimicrobium hydrocarbonivorans]QNR23004.1 lysozyme [Croceimicrobium hydrocarbonivorans]
MKQSKVLQYSAIGAGAVALGLFLFYYLRKNFPLPGSLLFASRDIKNYIKQEEKLRLNAYRDPGGVWTIGYGHTSDSKFPVNANSRITQKEANLIFEHDVDEAEHWVRERLKRSITQNQFDALVSHTFNTGGSTRLMKLVNENAHPDDIYHWFTSRYTSQNGQLLAGLLTRRREEAEIFFAS